MSKLIKKLLLCLLIFIGGFFIGLEIPIEHTSFKQIVYDISYAPLTGTIILIGFTTSFTMIQMKMQDRKRRLEDEKKEDL